MKILDWIFLCIGLKRVAGTLLPSTACMLDLGGDTPEADPLIGQAARANAEVAQKALDWYMKKDEDGKPRQAQLDALATRLAEQQISTSDFNDQAAREQWERYKSVGIPAEDRMYKDAANYGSADAQAKAAGEAGTDVETAMSTAAGERRRQLARAGINPADGRALAMEQDTATTTALAKATAMNGARKGVRDMGIMLRKDAAGFAKGMPSTAAQTFGVAGAAGAGATGAVQGAISSSNQSTQTNGQGFGIGIQGNSSAGSILNQEYGNKIQANKGDNVLGSIAGIGLGLGSMGWKPFGK